MIFSLQSQKLMKGRNTEIMRSLKIHQQIELQIMITPAQFKSAKEETGVESLLVLDDKGFLIHNSNASKQQSPVYNYFELYQLSKYFYPETDHHQQTPIVGIETGSHLTMIKAERDAQGEQKIVVIKERIINLEGEGNTNF